VTVYAGGDFLVADGLVHQVKVSLSGDRGLTAANLEFADTDSPLPASGGELHGLVAARDQTLGGFLDKLDDFAGALAFEFNKVFASGQGHHGYDAATSESSVTAADKPLDQAGLAFTPVNGSFQVLVYDTKAKTTKTADVQVRLLGGDDDTTLQDLADALSQIDSLSAAVTPDGRLSIDSQSAAAQFAFASDTSGVLAALGINTLFTGSTARDLGVSQAIASDPGKFAASRGGIGADTQNALILAKFPDLPIASHNDETITTIYDRLVADTAQGSAVTHATAQGAKAFEQTLRGQKLAISGVSIDEEAVNMLAIQRAFQASARYIGVVNQLLETLLNI
jgi:flagellar hook-associated protein 1 FlgK